MAKAKAKKTDMISYCGMYCGTCPAYTQSLAVLAKDLQKELHHSKCDKAARSLAKIPAFSAFKHYDRFSDLLEVLAQMVCKKPCRMGGGSPQCKIRLCAWADGLSGCWECGTFSTCKDLKALADYGDADKTYLKNLRKIKRQGPDAFVRSQAG
jgi:hypothetical protein